MSNCPDDLPCVSVIIACHNAENTLGECIESIVSQDYTGNIEIIVYDDASTDRSRSIVQEWAARLVSHDRIRLILTTNEDVYTSKPHGPAFARNRSVEKCKGSFICVQDADDVAMPNRISMQL